MSVSDLVEAAQAIVLKARTDGTLSEITPKSIRRQIEQALGLDEGAADAFKDQIKTAVNQILSESDKENDGNPVPTVRTKQSTAEGSASKPNASKKRKSDATDDEATKKTKTASGKAKPVRKRGAAAKKTEQVASSEVKDADSDREEEAAAKAPSSKMVIPKKVKAATVSKEQAVSSPWGVESEGSAQVAPKESTPKAKSSAPAPAEVPAVATAKRVDDVSDTEMSSVYDEPQVKRSKSKSKKSKDGPGKEPAKGKKVEKEKKSEKPQDKDEEMIKKLKSLIVACGVRKAWSKELAGCSTPREQIVHLKRLLQDLGMDGRMTLEKTKEIRAKRELAQEIEDVVAFERTKGRTAAEARKAAEEAKVKLAEQVESEEDEQELAVARKNRNAQLFAFIGDQSSDDE